MCSAVRDRRQDLASGHPELPGASGHSSVTAGYRVGGIRERADHQVTRERGREMAKTDRSGRMNRRQGTMVERRGCGVGI